MSVSDSLETALLAAREGLSTVPPKEDGTKRPIGTWKKYQTTPPDEIQIREWYQNGRSGVGLVCGEVSGGLEMLEFEGRAVRDGIHDRFKKIAEDAGLGDALATIRNGYVEETPSGGIHVLWRCTEVDGNLSLARRVTDDGEVQVLIETRGEGGYTIVAPSSGPVHETGNPYMVVRGDLGTIPTITPDERRELLNIARSLDEMPEEPKDSYNWSQATTQGGRPGDDYNDRATGADVVALLERHGWEQVYQFPDRAQMRRPGKTVGVSATVFDSGVFVCFTTSTIFNGYVQGTRDGVYSPFAVYAILEHDGDYSAAARALNPESQVIVPSASADSEDDAFWASRPELERIRTYAQAQMAAPHAVLAVVLARIVCQTPAMVVLPDIIYDFASLNPTIALVADSGGGKGGSAAVGAAAVHVGPVRFNTHTLGTGQGIAHGYAHHEKGETVRHADAVLFTVEEVDHLAAHNSQTGSTTLAELRRFGMGEKLGHLYVDPKRRIEIPAHSYRGAVIVAVQPARAGVILNAADGGTPQRFYWTPTIDPHPPTVEPDRPEPWKWRPPSSLPVIDRGYRPIPVCQQAADAIRQAQRDRRDGKGDPLDGHALLTRERIAATLGILSGRYEVDDEDWQLAGHLMLISDTTRGHVVETLAEKSREANRQRGEYEAERSVIVTEAVEEAAAKRVARLIVRHLPEGDPVPRGELRKKLASRDRGYFDDAIDRLAEAGQIDTVDTEHGTHYRKAET